MRCPLLRRDPMRTCGGDSMKIVDRKTSLASAAITRRRFATLAAGTATFALAPRRFARAQSGAVLKIGHIQPLTGPSAAYGIPARVGALMAVVEINAGRGGADRKREEDHFEKPPAGKAEDSQPAQTFVERYQAGDYLVPAIRRRPAGDRRAGADQLGRLRAARAGRRPDQAADYRQRFGRAHQGVEPLRVPGQSGGVGRGPDYAAEDRRQG